MVKNKNAGKPRNYALASGVYRFGKSKTFHKKAIYKFLKKKVAAPAKAQPKTFVEKQIGGAKNGPGSSLVWFLDLEKGAIVATATGVGNESYGLAAF